MEEKWKEIEGYDGFYEVSNKGRVRSWKNNKWGRSDSYKILSPCITKLGYPQVQLCMNGKPKMTYIHRLVAIYFVENPDNKYSVNHKDLNRENNNYYNLEWCTQSENTKHAYDNKTHDIPRLKGEEHGNSKLTEDDVIEIRYIYENNPDITQRILSERYNVTQRCIWSIVKYKTWTHV